MKNTITLIKLQFMKIVLNYIYLNSSSQKEECNKLINKIEDKMEEMHNE